MAVMHCSAYESRLPVKTAPMARPNEEPTGLPSENDGENELEVSGIENVRDVEFDQYRLLALYLMQSPDSIALPTCLQNCI